MTTRAHMSLQSIITHEVKNYLYCLDSNLESLYGKENNKSPGETKLENFNNCKTAIVNIEKLMFALSDVYTTPRREVINISELLWEQISMIESLLNLKNITLTCDLEDNLNICGDYRQLGRCFLNLLKNAHEACKEGDSIHVSAKRNKKENKCVIEIKDTGSGMSKDTLKCLFTPFFTTKKTGTGIGMYISKTVVEKHNGDISVVFSEEGQGTTLNLTFQMLC